MTTDLQTYFHFYVLFKYTMMKFYQHVIAILFVVVSCFAPLNVSAQKLDAGSLFGNMRARQIGPALMSGRISDLTGHPKDNKIIYVGTAGGGVWRSNDSGVSFTSIFDDHVQSIGAVTLDPTQPDQVVWVGTGECWTRNSVSVGDGIYKSVDAGKNWVHMGLENSERISAIHVNPKNSNEIFVGVLGALWGDSEDRGVYKSVDGGTTWEKILFVNAGTGCADLAMDPTNPDILYASFWEFRRTAFSFSSGGNQSALYKSVDGGKSWNKIHNGFPSGTLGRIAIAIAPSQPQTLYTVIESEKAEEKGLYRSDDGGANWKHVNSTFELSVRPFYFSRIVIDPTNPEIICKAGLFGSISIDGGLTFRMISGPHPDIHDFWFDIHDSKRLFLATDGGVYRSFDGGFAWDMVRCLPVSQYYHVTVDNQQPFYVYGGLQDNGSWIGPSSKTGGIEGRDWTSVGYGDGFRVYPHPADPNIVYSEMQGADAVWRVNRARNQAKTVKPFAEAGDPKLRFNWNTPISTSLHKPDRLFIGSQFLHLSNDRGETWQKISPDLTTNDPAKQLQEKSGGLSADNSGAENHCTIFTIAESSVDENVIWAGTDDGNVQVTFDGGKTWTNVTANMPGVPKNTWTYHIEASNFSTQGAYVVFDGHTQNDKTPYVYKTMDGGKTWKSLVTDEIKGFARCIQEDYQNPKLLYLGTEFGLFISLDGGLSWSQFTTNMPSVSVMHIELHPRDHALVIATHGRGVIIIDDVRPLRQMTEEIAEKGVHFFEREASIMRDPGAFGGYSSPGEFVGENPSSAAQIVYYLKGRHTFGKMAIEILDQQGNIVSELTPEKSKGINIVEWNYQHRLPKTAKGKTLTFGSFSAPRVLAGTYTVRMTKGKEVIEMPLEVKYDPESIYSIDERHKQYNASMTLFKMTEDLAFDVEQIDRIQGAADSILNNTAAKKVLKSLQPFAQQFRDLKAPLVVMKGDNYVGTAEPQLREKISQLYSAIVAFPGSPTNAQMDNLKLLDGKLREAEAKLDALIDQLPAINKILESAGIEPIKPLSKAEFFKA